MEKSLYLECYSGISGDMAVAALLDLGADQKVLEEVLASLPVQGFGIKVSRVEKSGIDACDFDVILDKEIDGHDHDMEYLHGHEHAAAAHEGETQSVAEHVHSHEEEHSHEHTHSHEEAHSHEYAHSHEEAHSHEHAHSHEDHTHHHHQHRGMNEIRQIIAGAKMTEGARKTALAIFEILAKAEAKAHNVPVEEVHFHEVGAVDSIVDILSVAVCLDNPTAMATEPPRMEGM